MKPQDKVISFELAKKIYEVAKKKGIELPESKFVWAKGYIDGKPVHWDYEPEKEKPWLIYDYPGGHTLPRKYWTKDAGWIRKHFKEKRVPAYTIDELFEWLPDKIIVNSKEYILCVLKRSDGFTASYHNAESLNQLVSYGVYAWDRTPADALCKLAIKLIEERVIK